MSKKQFVLAIDQGTSGTKSILFDEAGKLVAKGSVTLKTLHFDNGFVEQEPEDIYQNVLQSVKQCVEVFIQKGYDLSGIISCGISNQRETFMLWDAQGQAVSPAVVWACKKIYSNLRRIKSQGTGTCDPAKNRIDH